jgi:hypothetical protein
MFRKLNKIQQEIVDTHTAALPNILLNRQGKKNMQNMESVRGCYEEITKILNKTFYRPEQIASQISERLTKSESEG